MSAAQLKLSSRLPKISHVEPRGEDMVEGEYRKM
jgi:hypothetical protein